MRMKKRSKKPVRSHHVADLKKLRLFVRKQSTPVKAATLVAALGIVILVVAVSSDMQPRKVGGQAAALKTSATATTTVPAESASTLPVIPPPVAEESVAQEPARQAAAVTITGCLERDATTFRLKDTTGEDAPKARSWKSAFLKKGSASVEVIDAAHRMKLPSHVGQRVRVTGMLVNREMQVRSITRIAPSCAVKS